MAPVFVIDDHADTHESIKLLFEIEGCATACFFDFEAALQQLNHSNPSLILTDANVPSSLSVRQFIAQAKARRPGVKVVLYSGDTGLLSGWRLLGADGFVLKPGEFGDLIALVKSECKAA